MTESAQPAIPLRQQRESPEFDGPLVVAARTYESEGVVSLDLASPTGQELPSWHPGAHVDVMLANGLTRQYSLCGSVADRERWRIGVLREPHSRGGSQWLHDHALLGTQLYIRGVRNNFPLVPAPSYLFIAGGIGVTPLLPMLAHVQAAGAHCEIYYCGRSRAHMAFLGQLTDYGERVHIIARDETGRLDLAGLLATARPGTAIYCCGPVPLVESVTQHSMAWPPGSLHVEHFAATPTPDGVVDEPFEVEFRASGLTVVVPADKSILQAAENAGVYVQSACAEGTCGSCETDVLEGEVDHRDTVLNDEERKSNTTIMICVSRARCKRLVLGL